MAKLSRVTKTDGKRILYNAYDCKVCLSAGIPHQIVEVLGPLTDRYSEWGPGVATTMFQCSNCKAKDGPWVSAKLVGDY